MRKVVFAEKYFVLVHAERGLDGAANPELVDDPGDHGLAKDFPGLWIGLENGHEDAVEFPERLFEKDDVVEILAADPCRFEAELYGSLGKAKIVLDAAEALLFGGGDKLAVTKEGGRSIMVVARDS